MSVFNKLSEQVGEVRAARGNLRQGVARDISKALKAHKTSYSGKTVQNVVDDIVDTALSVKSFVNGITYFAHAYQTDTSRKKEGPYSFVVDCVADPLTEYLRVRSDLGVNADNATGIKIMNGVLHALTSVVANLEVNLSEDDKALASLQSKRMRLDMSSMTGLLRSLQTGESRDTEYDLRHLRSYVKRLSDVIGLT